MIDHTSLGTTRYAESVDFYSRVLAPLGLQLLRDTGSEAAFGTAERWCFFLYPVPAGEPVTARGHHVAFAAPSRAAVAAMHAAAVAATARDIFTPRTRPDISDSYFGAMFHDLDGHRIEVTTNAGWGLSLDIECTSILPRVAAPSASLSPIPPRCPTAA